MFESISINIFAYYVASSHGSGSRSWDPSSWKTRIYLQYIPRNMHTVFALLCFVVVIHWLIFPYPSGLLHWHCGNLTIAPVPAKQPWWIWINTSCEFIMNDCITTTKQSTTKPCAYFLGYTVCYMGNIKAADHLTMQGAGPVFCLFLRVSSGCAPPIVCVCNYLSMP